MKEYQNFQFQPYKYNNIVNSTTFYSSSTYKYYV